MRDLVLKGRFGRGTTTATLLLHRIRPPVWPGRSLTVLDAIYPALVRRFGYKIQTEFLAHNAGEEAAHRMLLPFRGRHDSGDRRASRRPQHRKNAGVLSIGPG